MSSLVRKDQAERNEYQSFVKTNAGGDWEAGAQQYAKAKGRSADDIFGERERYSEFVQKADSFPYDQFTEEDWKNYWTIAQHIDFDRDFQKSALKKIERHLGADSEEYKYLYDRISCGTTGKQKYNTQDVCEIS